MLFGFMENEERVCVCGRRQISPNIFSRRHTQAYTDRADKTFSVFFVCVRLCGSVAREHRMNLFRK